MSEPKTHNVTINSAIPQDKIGMFAFMQHDDGTAHGKLVYSRRVYNTVLCLPEAQILHFDYEIPFKSDHLLTGNDVKQLHRIGQTIAPTCRDTSESVGEVMTLTKVMIRGPHGFRKL